MAKLNNEQTKEIIISQFNKEVQDFTEAYNLLSLRLANKNLLGDLFNFLKSHSKLQFQFLTTLCGMHYPKEKTISVVYHLQNMKTNTRIRIKVDLDENKPEIDTITNIFPGANWMERETYDFYGVIFKGHTNLKRILNMEELEVFPMRKEYPLEDPNKIDKNDAQFGR